jgi:general secretion pathway protein B
MSYILEALRRAEAERQRGAVPGLHTQPMAAALPAGQGSADAAQRTWRPGTWALAGLLLAGLLAAAVGLGWLLKPPSAVVAVATPPVVLSAARRSFAPAVPPQAVGLAAGAAAVQRAALAAAAPPVPLIAPATASAEGLARLPPPRRAPAPTAAPATRPITEPAAASTRSPLAAAATVAAAAAPPAPAPVAAGPGSAPARLPTLAELPDALRREVQPLNLGGAVYADKATLRIVIVNGQVFHEGDKPFPALQVQQIGLRSVVFSVRGQRFEMPL